MLLHTNSAPPSLPRPFKFETMWIAHPDTCEIIHSAWNQSQSFLARLKNTKMALKTWNLSVFGHVQQRIHTLQHLIHNCQTSPQTAHSIQSECTLQQNLDELLKREELIWRDKAKARWLEEGDANTHFFHLSTIIHRWYNAINRIFTSHNVWLNERDPIGNTFVDYFSNLFQSVLPSYPNELQGLIGNTFSGNIISNLRLYLLWRRSFKLLIL